MLTSLEAMNDERVTNLQKEIDAACSQIEDLTLQLETKNMELQKTKDESEQ